MFQSQQDLNTMQRYQAVMASDLSELDKVKEGFKLVADFYIIHGEREIELLRAMNDRENLVKQQIKVSTVRHMLSAFVGAYEAATGQKVTYEHSER